MPQPFAQPEPAAMFRLFDRTAPTYDLLNDVLSLGLHRLWKRQAVARLQPRPGARIVDLCCGTGDLALLLAERVRPHGRVIGVDGSAAALEQARQRAAERPWLPLEFIHGDVLTLPLTPGAADGVMMAYGLRNLASVAAGLEVMRHLLKPHGRGVVLDFNRPPHPLWAQAQRRYLQQVVTPVARVLDLEGEYAYLERSIAAFATGTQQETLARQAGFTVARHHPVAGGLMGLLDLSLIRNGPEPAPPGWPPGANPVDPPVRRDPDQSPLGIPTAR